MEEYLNTPIKEIITKFSEIGKILEEYNIGCVPCSVGSCLLKDIVEIHNLSIDQEKELLTKMSKVIYPDREVVLPILKRKAKIKKGEIKYSPPIKKLVDEHVLIKRLLALIPKIVEGVDVESEESIQVIRSTTDFIRFYADKYHHAKEEEILFGYFDKDLDILKVMHEDHESARRHVRSILEGLANKEKNMVIEHLSAYQELLIQHIKKEDEILYPWMDRNLSVKSVGELFSRFNEADEKQDKKMIDRCKNFVVKLENQIHRLKKEVKQGHNLRSKAT